MKKILLLLCMICVLCFPTISYAGETLSLKASTNTVSAGNTVTMMVVMSGNLTAKSASISVTSYSGKLELVTGKWQKSGVMDSFDGRDGVIAFAQETNVDGNLFQLTFKARAYDSVKQTVQVNLKLKNADGTIIFDSNASTQIQVQCATHQYGSWSLVSGATCIENGTEQRSCSVCGDIDIRNLNALGHSWSSYTETKRATCTEAGIQTRTCSLCKKNESKALEKLKHNMDKAEITKKPTCTDPGEKVGTCKSCGHQITEKIPALGHDFSEWQEKVAPTFTNEGRETRRCSACNMEETRTVEALGYLCETPFSQEVASIVYYNVSEVVEQKDFQVRGYANVKFKITNDDYDTAKLFYVTETGVMEEVAAITSEDGNYLEARITKQGIYAVYMLSSNNQNESHENVHSEIENSENVHENGIRIMNLIFIALFVIETLFIVMLFIKRKIRLKGDDASES